MKSSFLLSGLCWLALPFLLPAQSTLGIQGGMNLSNVTLTGPTPFVTSSQGNFFLGVNARTPLGQHWAINSDAQYMRRGFFMHTVTTPERRLGFRLNYVEVGIKAEYNIFKNLHLQMGGYAGYRTEEYVRENGANAWVKPVYPLTDHWDVGLQGGLAAYFQRWSAFVRYSHGLKVVGQLDITDENGGGLGSVRIFNRGLQIGAGYSIFNW